MARGLKFWIKEGEGLNYPCSENKDADQFRGYREADLRLCFRICKKQVFSRCGSLNGIQQTKLTLDLLPCVSDPKTLTPACKMAESSLEKSKSFNFSRPPCCIMI